MKNRGGYASSHSFAVDAFKHYFRESAYQLCNGNAINTGYFSIHSNICGTFNSQHETLDPKRHRVDFRFRTLAAMCKLIDDIAVDVMGIVSAMAILWILPM